MSSFLNLSDSTPTIPGRVLRCVCACVCVLWWWQCYVLSHPLEQDTSDAERGVPVSMFPPTPSWHCSQSPGMCSVFRFPLGFAIITHGNHIYHLYPAFNPVQSNICRWYHVGMDTPRRWVCDLLCLGQSHLLPLPPSVQTSSQYYWRSTIRQTVCVPANTTPISSITFLNCFSWTQHGRVVTFRSPDCCDLTVCYIIKLNQFVCNLLIIIRANKTLSANSWQNLKLREEEMGEGGDEGVKGGRDGGRWWWRS